MKPSIDNILVRGNEATKAPQAKRGKASGPASTSVGKEGFDQVLKGTLGPQQTNELPGLSSHASKRLERRQLDMNNQELLKIKEAMGKLKSKGGKDSLVITDQAAYIVDVENNKVVTAVGREQMKDNIFTKIDSTVLVN